MANNNDIDDYEIGIDEDISIDPNDTSGEQMDFQVDQEHQDVFDAPPLPDDVSPEITNESSELASTPGKNILVLAILGIASIVFLYQFVFDEDEVKAKQEEIQQIIESQPVENAVEATRPEGSQDAEIGIIDIPDLPDIADIQAPVINLDDAPSLDVVEPFAGFEPSFLADLDEVDEVQTPAEASPPPQQVAVEIPIESNIAEPLSSPEEIRAVNTPKIIQPTGPTSKELEARKNSIRKSKGFVINGNRGLPSSEFSLSVDKDGKPVTRNVTLSHTSAQQVTATNIGETDFIIAQGKMIEAVLETAINTQLAGMLRAVVSRDIYGESGNYVLIPKGSRLVGTYNDKVSENQFRVEIQWQRVIRPDGIDIAINSPSTDKLGRAGTSGFVDRRFFDALSNSILLSLIAIGSASASGEVTDSLSNDNQGNTTQTTSGNAKDLAIIDSVKSFGDVSEKITSELLEDEPIILVNQGTRVNVFVNRDIIFPKSTVFGKSQIN